MYTKEGEETKTGASELNGQLIEQVDAEDDREFEAMSADDESGPTIFPISVATIWFQGLMIFASVYFAMLVSNWGQATFENDADEEEFFSANWMSFWVKILSLFFSATLYLFSLLGPVIFPDRDWS